MLAAACVRRWALFHPSSAIQATQGVLGPYALFRHSSTESESELKGLVRGQYEVDAFPPDRIRNFSIIAHVDHGKSTLADRLMEMTGAIEKGSQNQYLDKLQVERERGITVKAQTASLVWRLGGKEYLLNLIDTPGHVDFSYEVSRSLAACQGALLVVDAAQGIQAQTVANFYLAFEQGLDLVPVVNKIDLPAAEPERVAQEIEMTFDLKRDAVLLASARTGQGLREVLDAVVQRMSPPRGDPSAPLRLLLFDAYHDVYRGVVLLVAVVDGVLSAGDTLQAASSGQVYEAAEVGMLAPEPHSTRRLLTGQVGYLVAGVKRVADARVGDTWHHARARVAPLPGFRPAQAMVHAGLYPVSGDDFETLATAMEKLTLNDNSVSVKRESSDALGAGFRCGFLGMLHMEVFMQRLQDEHGAHVITTQPTVPYIVDLGGGDTRTLTSAAEFPTHCKVVGVQEPTVQCSIVTPSVSVGRVMTLCAERRGDLMEHSHVGGERALLRYTLPLAELATDFYSRLKSATQGYASFDYEPGPYRVAALQRLDVMVNGAVVDALARVVHRDDAQRAGRALCARLAQLLDRQQFELNIQAAAGGRVIASERVRAVRKDVTAKCYGGDVSRKRKLLEKQKEGKRRMRQLGNVQVPQEVFPELMRTR